MIEEVKKIFKEGKKVIAGFKAHLSDKDITLDDVAEMVFQFCKIAEKIMSAPKQGALKHTVVLDLWREADKELGITEKLSHIIPDSLEVSFWSKAVKIPLPKVDLSFIVDKVIIPTVVHIANRLGWKSW